MLCFGLLCVLVVDCCGLLAAGSEGNDVRFAGAKKEGKKRKEKNENRIAPHFFHFRAKSRHNTTQHNTTQHNTTQHNTTQHNTTQHNTTQQRTI